MSCMGSFQSVCRKIICPARHGDFNEHDMSNNGDMKKNSPPYELFTVKNENGYLLSVMSINFDTQNLPTVLYLHGNGGHKMEALQFANPRFNLVAFDFGACGKSEGEYLTYGERQAKDIAVVVSELKRRYGIRKVALWGRSMGASLGIMYASSFQRDVSCLILDTPFRWLKDVVRNVASHNNSNLPGFLLNLGLYMIEGKLKEMVGVDIFQTDFQMYLNLLKLPALFVCSTMDNVVRQQNVKQLYEAYKGQKLLRFINSLHHQDRPKDLVEEVIKFIAVEEGSRSTRSSMTCTSKKGITMSLRGNTSLK